MRWKGRKQSSNVEDRRGQRMPASGGGARRAGGGLLNLLLMGFMRASGKTRVVMIVVGLLAFMFFREPLMQILGLSSNVATGPRIEQTTGNAGQNDEMKAYLSTMMADNEQVWSQILPKYGVKFRPCKMVIYSERTRTPGGLADARMGPFYSPGDETIYIDPSFFRELKEKFGATGDFAEAYVVAHEYGHHIENILGRLDELHKYRGRLSKTDYNKKSVRVELHADFLSGVFARSAQETFGTFLEEGDIEEAMRAAQAIGDDRIQKNFGPGYVDPDSFTHGTSAQRAKWFKMGLESGDLQVGEQLYKLPYEQL